MKADQVIFRVAKLGAAASCGYGAFVCFLGAALTRQPIWYVPAAGLATASVTMLKQAIFGYKEEA